MAYSSIRNMSYTSSVFLHLVLMILFYIWTITIDYPPRDYVELSFGISGEFGSSGAIGTQIEKIDELAKPEEQTETKNQTAEVREVELPKATQTSDQNAITPAEKDKQKSEVSRTETKDTRNQQVTTTGQGNRAIGDGSFGFVIEWGGKGTRRIYNYIIPDYPEGVQKEINIRLSFTILPDGTIGTIIPVTKADTRLENVAINSLRQWRFEPLSSNQPQNEQAAVIDFPFRLQ